MRSIRIFTFCFAMILFVINHGYTQWSVYQIDPNRDIYSVFAYPSNTVFSGTANGIRYSNDNGTTWINRGLTGLKVTAIAGTDSLNLFAGTSTGLILKSTNLGVNWTIIMTVPKYVNCMTAISSKLFIGTDTALYSYHDPGITILEVLANTKSLSSSGLKVFAGSLNGVVYFTSNGGANWVTRTTQPKPNTSITALTFDGSIIYAGMSASSVGDTIAIYKSTNDGNNWITLRRLKSVAISIPCLVNGIVASGNNITYGNSLNGVEHSTNGGTNWTIKNDTLGNRWISSLILSNGKLIAGTKGGVFTSNYPNIIWSNVLQLYNKDREKPVKIIIKRPPPHLFPTGTLFLASSLGIFRTSNYGSNWVSINNGLSSTTASSVGAMSNGRLFAGTTNGIYTKLYTDSNWVYSNIAQNDIIDFSGNGSNVYAISPTAGVFRSSNNGSSWSAINTGLPSTNVNAIANKGDTLYCGILDRGLYRAYPSTGFTWINISTQDSSIGSIEVNGNNIYAYGRYFGRSTDNGNNWTYSFPPGPPIIWHPPIYPPPDLFNFTLLNNSNDIYATDPDSGVYRSTNFGTNWTNISNELGGLNYLSIAADSLYLYTTDEYGCIWKRPLQSIITGTQNISNEIPSSFSLEQNYPNPFNPVTKIKFAISKSDFVKLKIYDITGRLMQTLTNEKLNAGIYEVSFNGSNFASGVYFYKLETENYSETKKMLLIK